MDTPIRFASWRSIAFLIAAAATAACKEPPRKVLLHNPVYPLALTFVIDGKPSGRFAEPDIELDWKEGAEVQALFDLGCGPQVVSVSVLSETAGASRLRACFDGFACAAVEGGALPVQWIDVSIDNRAGEAGSVGLGTLRVPIAAGVTARVRVPASTCEAGSRVTLGDAPVGSLPAFDPEKSSIASAGPIAFALLDVAGTHCYSLRSDGTENPVPRTAADRQPLYLVRRIDDFLPPDAIPETTRAVLADAACAVPEPAVTRSKPAKKKKPVAGRPGSDPIGRAIDALSAKVTACATSLMPDDEWTVKISAHIVVNLQGQLLDSKVAVTPRSDSSERVGRCVATLIQATRFPKGPAPINTVHKVWTVRMR